MYVTGTTNLAPLFSDDGITATTNPVITNAQGVFGFYVADGRYDLQITGANIATLTIHNVEIADITQAGPGSGDLPWQTDDINFVNQTSNPATPAAGTINLFTLQSSKHIYIEDDTGLITDLTATGGGGGSTTPGAPTNSLQKNSGASTFVASNVIDNGTVVSVNEDVQFQGPNPYKDARTVGVRSTSSTVAPAIPGITATISTNIAALSSASSFQNGDGVTVFGAGAPHGMSTPTTPTVTPSIAAVSTGTGLVVPAPTGSTIYNYVIVARSTAGGLTAASPVSSTTTGNSLGSQSVAISTQTRSGTTVTANTVTPHGLAFGSMIYITGTNDSPQFEGWFVVNGTPTGNSFTYLTGLDANSGADTGATGGTVFWFNCNHVTWTAVSGAFCYYIYGRSGGSLNLLGVSLPTQTYWDDFGSPMMDSFQAPFYVPTTAPSVATSNNLTTTIVSGAGTTTLTLAASASTAVTSATILFDNAPNLLAAVVAAGGLEVYIPWGNYVINSYLTLPQAAIAQAGQLYLNDTLQMPDASRWYGNLSIADYGAPNAGWEGLTPVVCGRAGPGIYAPVANSFVVRGLGFTTTQPNNAHLIVLGGAINSTWENVLMETGVPGSSADYMGVAFTTLGSADVFFNSFRHLTLSGGPGNSGVFNGSTATPVMQFLAGGSGNFSIEDVSISGARGFFMAEFGAGAHCSVKFGRIQGGLMPAFVFYTAGGGVGGAFDIQAFELDTMSHPLIANLSNPDGLLAINFMVRGTDTPSADSLTGGLVSLVSGAAMQMLYEGSAGPAGFGPGTLGQNTGLIAGPYFSNNTVNVSGGGSFIYPVVVPGAPTVTVSAGGSFPIGTFQMAITVLDAQGKESAIGTLTPFTTTAGNQTITVTPPAAPIGAIAWRPYQANFPLDGSSPVLCDMNPYGGCAVALSFGTIFVDSAGFNCATEPPQVNGASRASIGQNGLSGYEAILGGGITFASLGVSTSTINGTVTYCQDCVAGSNPCTGGGTGAMASRLNGAWSCGSSSVNNFIKTVVTLTSSQLLNLATTPVQLIPSPGAGLYINVVSMALNYTAGSTPYTVGGTASILFLHGANGQELSVPTTNFLNQTVSMVITPMVFTGSVGSTQFVGPAVVSEMVNQNFNANGINSTITLGNGTLTLIIYYTIEAIN